MCLIINYLFSYSSSITNRILKHLPVTVEVTDQNDYYTYWTSNYVKSDILFHHHFIDDIYARKNKQQMLASITE